LLMLPIQRGVNHVCNNDKEHSSKDQAEVPNKMNPPIVSQQEWETACQQLLVKEKSLTRSRDALAAERRRMPWLAVGKKYEFDGPRSRVSLLDLLEGRRQLIVYRAFFEPGYSAGPITPAAAAPWAPIRSPTWPI
jgi:predicted dithiol-disulfide oxidoreductase (DUF899 family)